jgi:cytochrome c
MKSWLLAAATLIAATALPAMLQKAAAQDVEKGQRSFNKCLPCHAIGPGAENKVGPDLNGLDGRHAGAVASFNYSEANKNSGLVWNEATFKDYIRSPQAKIPGTKMAFAGITNPQEIDDFVGLSQTIRRQRRHQEITTHPIDPAQNDSRRL